MNGTVSQAQIMAMDLGRRRDATAARREAHGAGARRIAAALLGAAWFVCAALFVAYMAAMWVEPSLVPHSVFGALANHE